MMIDSLMIKKTLWMASGFSRLQHNLSLTMLSALHFVLLLLLLLLLLPCTSLSSRRW
jgi:hypothetical protein